MASACVTTAVPVAGSPSGEWIGPRASFSLDDSSPSVAFHSSPSSSSPDFEFQPTIPDATLPAADELFAGGKLVPLSPLQEPISSSPPSSPPSAPPLTSEAAAPGGAAVSPSRWRKLLRLKKKQQARSKNDQAALKQLLLPSQEPSEADAASSPSPPAKLRLPKQPAPAPPATTSANASQTALPVAADSPRLNAAGKVVYQGLGRSSSSPSSLAGGGGSGRPRTQQRGIERSYSAHVRVAPVLHVPVCSLRGARRSVSVFGIGKLFSPSTSRGPAAAAAAAAAKTKNEQSKS